MGMNGGSGNMMKFSSDPFYLYAIKEDMVERLFVNREDEISIVKGILEMPFGDNAEICAIIGGIGVGKSSILQYVKKLAREMEFDVIFYSNPDKFFSESGKIDKGKNKKVCLIDDIGTVDDMTVRSCYASIEEYLGEHGGMVFFTDTYDREHNTLERRNFIVSQNISLSIGLDREKLKYFLMERMKKCLAPGEKFDFPFDKEGMEIASIRSGGNLRNFLNYSKNAWLVAAGSEKDTIRKEDMKKGIITVDRALLGGCDLIDFKILWYSTIGDINKSYLAHQCSIDTKTLDSRLYSKLSEITSQKKQGKDVIVTSIYKYIDGGEDILSSVMEGLGIHKKDITGL
jgi:hypothetical protein